MATLVDPRQSIFDGLAAAPVDANRRGVFSFLREGGKPTDSNKGERQADDTPVIEGPPH